MEWVNKRAKSPIYWMFDFKNDAKMVEFFGKVKKAHPSCPRFLNFHDFEYEEFSTAVISTESTPEYRNYIDTLLSLDSRMTILDVPKEAKKSPKGGRLVVKKEALPYVFTKFLPERSEYLQRALLATPTNIEYMRNFVKQFGKKESDALELVKHGLALMEKIFEKKKSNPKCSVKEFNNWYGRHAQDIPSGSLKSLAVCHSKNIPIKEYLDIVFTKYADVNAAFLPGYLEQIDNYDLASQLSLDKIPESAFSTVFSMVNPRIWSQNAALLEKFTKFLSDSKNLEWLKGNVLFKRRLLSAHSTSLLSILSAHVPSNIVTHEEIKLWNQKLASIEPPFAYSSPAHSIVLEKVPKVPKKTVPLKTLPSPQTFIEKKEIDIKIPAETKGDPLPSDKDDENPMSGQTEANGKARSFFYHPGFIIVVILVTIGVVVGVVLFKNKAKDDEDEEEEGANVEEEPKSLEDEGKSGTKKKAARHASKASSRV